MKNPNAKYYKIPSKSQSLNPNAYRRNFKITINTKSKKFGSIGSYSNLGFPKSYANTGGGW